MINEIKYSFKDWFHFIIYQESLQELITRKSFKILQVNSKHIWLFSLHNMKEANIINFG